MPMVNSEPISAHRAEACKHLSPLGAKLFKYVEFDDDEELIAEIRKHPLGELITGLTGIVIATILAVSIVLLAVNLDSFSPDVGEGGGAARTLLLVMGVVLSLVALGATAIAVAIYRSNVIFVTNEKIAQVAYLSIFNRKVTQLSVGNVEDVTVHQKGIFTHIFNYGTIIVETAGEIANSAFTMVPHPNFYSQKIIDAHEKFVHKHGN